MAILNGKYRVKNSKNDYDIVYLETGANQVKFNDGKTFQEKLEDGTLKGDKGDKGDTGITPTIKAGSVTTGSAGSSATVTASTVGTTTTFNFVIPQGIKGDTGAKGDKGDQGIQGVKGDKGDKGEDGLTTSITVGSTKYTHSNGNITIPAYPTLSSLGASASSHTHSQYENQNAFSSVKVGSTTVTADSPTDTIELKAGSNITLTPDSTNDAITIAVNGMTVTSSEKSDWNAKETTSGSQAKADAVLVSAKSYTDTKVETKVEKSYVDTELSKKASSSHNHDSVYAKISHEHNSSQVTAMTGYSKSSTTSAITESDSLNSAIGKLEKALDGKQASGSYASSSHNHDSAYLSKTGTAVASNKLSTARKINGVSFDGTADITVADSTKVAPTGTIVANRIAVFNDTTGKVIKDSGFTIGASVPSGAKFTDTIYTHPSTHDASMITEDEAHRFVSDTEKTTWNAKETTSGSQAKADKAKADAISSAKSYTDTKVAQFIDSAPETLDTLNELAKALGNDPNFATTIATQIGTKADTSYVNTELDKKANASHGTHVTYSTTAPLSNGTASVGTSGSVSRGDHVHPLQTTVSGNAGTATKLQTARTINGTSFDGSGNITTSNWGTARNISITDNDSTNTGSAVSVNGSTNISLKLPSTIKASLSGNASTSTKATQDSAGQQINTTYIKGLSVSGKTITYTKGDGTTGTITTQDTDTHYTAKNIVGASATATANATSSNGSTYINLIENGAVRSTHKITGSGATTVTSDANGNIVISSTDTNTNTTYTAGTGMALSGTTFNHKNSVTAGTAQGDASKTLSWGGTFTIPTVTYDAQGHITAKGTTTMTMPSNPNSDTKVTNTLNTTTKAYITGTTSSSTNTGTQIFDTGVYLDTTAGMLTATTFKGALSGNASTATKLATARTISLGGILSGSANFDGSGNITITASANDITTITKSLIVGTSWMDTGITGTNLATGTYAVQMLVNDGNNTSQYQEYYSGTMSWFNGATNSTDADEILLHKAGHASNGRHVYLRTIRTANSGYLKLQISATHAFSDASNIIFKFKKLI